MTLNSQQAGFYNKIIEKQTVSQLISCVGCIDQMLSLGAEHPSRHWRETKVLLKKLKEVVVITPEDLAQLTNPPERKPSEPLSISIMKPVEPEVAAILKDLEDPTRKYMKARLKKSPEDKFYSTMCESWRYGWRLKDSRLMSDKVFPKVNMRRSFLRINGIERDPDNYRQPVITKPNMCNTMDL